VFRRDSDQHEAATAAGETAGAAAATAPAAEQRPPLRKLTDDEVDALLQRCEDWAELILSNEPVQEDDEPPPPPIDTAADTLPAGPAQTTASASAAASTPLTVDAVAAMRVNELKEKLAVRGVHTGGRKEELIERLQKHVRDNPQFSEATDGVTPFQALTPIVRKTGRERRHGYKETFERPRFTGVKKGSLRMKRIISKKQRVGNTIVTGKTLNIYDHPLHFLSLWFDEKWREDNLAKPTRDAVSLDEDGDGKNRVYPGCRKIMLVSVWLPAAVREGRLH
jgi:hypothetical protein